MRTCLVSLCVLSFIAVSTQASERCADVVNATMKDKDLSFGSISSPTVDTKPIHPLSSWIKYKAALDKEIDAAQTQYENDTKTLYGIVSKKEAEIATLARDMDVDQVDLALMARGKQTQNRRLFRNRGESKKVKLYQDSAGNIEAYSYQKSDGAIQYFELDKDCKVTGIGTFPGGVPPHRVEGFFVSSEFCHSIKKKEFRKLFDDTDKNIEKLGTNADDAARTRLWGKEGKGGSLRAIAARLKSMDSTFTSVHGKDVYDHTVFYEEWEKSKELCRTYGSRLAPKKDLALIDADSGNQSAPGR